MIRQRGTLQYKKKVIPRKFELGYLVLRRADISAKQFVVENYLPTGRGHIGSFTNRKMSVQARDPRSGMHTTSAIVDFVSFSLTLCYCFLDQCTWELFFL